MKHGHKVASAADTIVSTNMPKFSIRIPTTGSDGTAMTFIHVISDTEWNSISRKEFFELIRSTPNAGEHVVPDIEGAIIYFVPDGEKYAQMSRVFCREAEKERMRNARHYDCILKGTDQCDGWTTNSNRENNCLSCNRRYMSKTISLEESYKDDEGNIVGLGSAVYDDTVSSVEELIQDRIDTGNICSAIACLKEDDQKFITDALQVGMNYAKLGRLYGIVPTTARKRFERIKNEICKSFVNR